MTKDELIARLEAATGSDRELDAVIAVAVTPGMFEEGGWVGFTGKGDMEPPLPYTASINDALMLVPQGWGGAIHFSENRQHHVAKLGRSYPTNANVYAEAPTPALAICIAALKARND